MISDESFKYEILMYSGCEQFVLLPGQILSKNILVSDRQLNIWGLSSLWTGSLIYLKISLQFYIVKIFLCHKPDVISHDIVTTASSFQYQGNFIGLWQRSIYIQRSRRHLIRSKSSHQLQILYDFQHTEKSDEFTYICECISIFLVPKYF